MTNLHERARRQLAVTIATDLLTVQGPSGPLLGTRLAVKSRTTRSGTEDDLGGWCATALENRIEKTIREAECGKQSDESNAERQRFKNQNKEQGND